MKLLSSKMIAFALLLFGALKGVSQDQTLLINEELALNSNPITVEELKQKRNFFNTQLIQYKFGDLILKEGKSNWGYTETTDRTAIGYKSIKKSNKPLTRWQNFRTILFYISLFIYF